jgi:hypothetical protein
MKRSALLGAVVLTAAVTIAATACGTTTAPNSGGLSAKFTVSARTASAAPAATRPGRAPSETIPAGARAVTVALYPDVNSHVKLPKPVTVTGPARVRGLVALVNGLPRFPAGRYSCPFDGGARLVLTFRAGPGSPASAVATVALEGCEGVALTLRGRDEPGLGSPDGGRPEATQALKIAGLNWSLPPFSA